MRTNDLFPTPHSPFPTRPESCSAHLSVKQAAQNRAVAPNGSIPSRLTCSDSGWCRNRFHKPAGQIRFLKSLLEEEVNH